MRNLNTFKTQSNLYLDYYELVDLLIETGADVNIQTTDGYTPLMLVAKNGID